LKVNLRFLGVAGFEVAWTQRKLLIDPFLSGNPQAPCSPDEIEKPDLILVSHAARDHYGDAAAIARRTGAPVLCDSASRALMIDQGVPPGQVKATTWGITTEIAGMKVKALECHHWSVAQLSGDRPVFGNAIAFLVYVDQHIRLYHYGDTCIFDMRLIGRLSKPTVGLIGCTTPRDLPFASQGPGRSVTGEMDAAEAALAVEMLGLQVAIACHYITPDEDVAEFTQAVNRSGRIAIAPRVGEVITIESDEDGRLRSTAQPAAGIGS
jgi:L-ascorbate metabolism protein UlaG (beta-lactamase superfamily)